MPDNNYQNIARVWKSTGNGRRCYWCGQYIQTGEETALLVIPRQYRTICPHNIIMHLSELRYLHPVQLTDDTAFYQMIATHSTPRIKLTAEDNEKLATFTKLAFDLGYRNITHPSKAIVKCRKRGKSDTIQYNVKLDTVDYYNNRKTCLFSSFADRQIKATIYNMFHERLNDGKHDDYDSKKEIHEIVSTVTEIIGKYN